MKNLLTILFLSAGIFLVGCSDQSSLVGPTGSDLNNQSIQTQGDSFISLPFTSLNKSKDSNEDEKNFGKEIDGAKGGKIKIKGNVNGVKYEAKLTIPKGAFEGTKKISVKFDGTKAAFDFSPNNFSFDKPLLFSAKIKGLNLDEINPDDIQFVYMLSNGTFASVIYDKMKVDVKDGKLEVKKAQINHFSRYGWAK